MPRKPRVKKPKAEVTQLVQQAAAESLPLETAATVVAPEPPPPAPEPQSEPVSATQPAPKHPAKRLRSIETKVIGGAKVHLIDTGYPNRAVGVQFEMPDGERPSDAVKAPLREGDAPLSYQPSVSTWLKRTGEDAVSDRVDVEMRFADAVQALRIEKEVEGPSR